MFQPKLEYTSLYQALDQIWSEGPIRKVHSTTYEDREHASRASAIKLHGSCNRPRAIHKSEGVILVRCRTCSCCINYRRRQWMIKSCVEAHRAERTWFVTLTFRRYSRYWLEQEAGILHSPMDVAYALTSPMIKAVRKKSAAPLKYISCVEEHKDGSPHLHMLLFQTTTKKVLYRHIVKSWRYGFAAAKLATPSSAYYVCKYLGKQMKSGSRIRVSRPFGRQDPDELYSESIDGLQPEQVSGATCDDPTSQT